MAQIIDRDQWAEAPDLWKGELQCGPFGADICLIFNYLEAPGGGPRLHKHPYPETFIIRQGRGLFTVGDRQIVAEAGQIVIVPADSPHRFTNLGPGPLETIDIHDRGEFSTTWLE